MISVFSHRPWTAGMIEPVSQMNKLRQDGGASYSLLTDLKGQSWGLGNPTLHATPERQYSEIQNESDDSHRWVSPLGQACSNARNESHFVTRTASSLFWKRVS